MVVASGSTLVLLPAVVARFRPSFLWTRASEPAPEAIAATGMVAES
jgi:hypothetical protein